MASKELSIFSGGGSSIIGREQIRAVRTARRVQIETSLREIVIDAETDVALVKVESSTTVAGAGMGAVTKLTKALEQFEQIAPAASARLNFVADVHAIRVGDYLDDHHRAIRRV